MPDFQFDGFMEFLAMGGYAIYVWPVYILFALFFATTVLPPTLGRKKILRQLRARMERLENSMAGSMDGMDGMEDMKVMNNMKERGESN